ncbi:Mur ligase family protein [Sulfobacillus harzensis]|uniref:Lipid II isoglutaminyl synthase (glutamine-hydrolyzing) subunit MurT n=1 Tax=Sulfobacillus harzensis TaxID=2729629 RepID=A0A7Y0Q2H5_9FIRM|nr:Mur ligase family protein [Sulfobacillus harzensis]NMP22517.1 Mur ligase family protein [Sulfobacillus harzensis]
MNPRTWLAVWAARLVGFLSRLTGRGGSSITGLVARRIDPRVLIRVSRRFAGGSLLLTGTNGKTTTAAMLRHILAGSAGRILANRSGANLISGLTAAFVQAERWRIVPRAKWAILETDEATMPRAGLEIEPRAIVVTNFFRDQLDRYGELSTTVNYVARGIEHLQAGGTLVLNADDPQVARLGTGQAHVLYYGLEGQPGMEAAGYDAVDARYCPACGTALVYDRRFYAHVGHYHCPHCGWRRPTPDVLVTRWSRAEETLWVRIDGEERPFRWRLPGVYNIYNQVAAMSAALALGINAGVVAEQLQSFRPAFGRMELVQAGDTRLWLALVKNPVGFNQVLGAMSEDDQPHRAGLIVINDQYADGRDVSWLWDVDFEHWIPKLGIDSWYVSGIRARDMAVRLKYAGVERDQVVVDESIPNILQRAMDDLQGGTLYVLPTYTAMLEVRNLLTHQGLVKHFREG